jgi:hypothetical protein
MHQTLRLLLTSTTLALIAAVPAMAQETTGVPGSPSATTTIETTPATAPGVRRSD